MFVEIHQLKEAGFNKSQVARRLNLNRKTVSKYWNVEPDQFGRLVEQSSMRPRKLDRYESIIVAWLKENPDMSAAQVEDWIKERYRDTAIKERTVRSYVAYLRKKHNIPKVAEARQYQAVEDPPMGHQMQLDLGEVKVRAAGGGKKKLYAVGAVLSHSRYKYAEWSDRPLTTSDLVSILANCFEFYGGVPREIVIDQDKLMVVSENYGDIVFTKQFEQFRRRMGFRVYLCRAGDPPSKGRIEAVVKYLKHGFAAHRTFKDLESWNQRCFDWLGRTANCKPHGTTKEVPAEVFALEKQYLRPVPALWEIATFSVTRMVRKDNTVMYKSNRYSVPIDTYRPGLEVQVEEEDNKLIIRDLETKAVIAEHVLSSGKGKLIQNRNHLRDYQSGVAELCERVQTALNYVPGIEQFLAVIKEEKGRYIRDQYKLILQLQEKHSQDTILRAFSFCHQNELYSATSLRDAVEYFAKNEDVAFANTSLTAHTLPEHLRIKANVRDIHVYSSLVQGGDCP